MYGFQSDAQARMSQLPEAEPTYSEQMAADLQRRNRTAKARARREFSDYAQEQADEAPAPADQLLYADGGSVGFGARGVAGLRDMIPKMQAMGYQQAAPAPAAPSAAERLRAMIPQVEAMGYKQQPQALADGGMVHSIKGMLGLRPKTREELLAADAKAQERNREAAARVAERSAQQPAPATPAPQSAITGYAGMSAMQRREKEQGLKNGGMVKPRGFKAGGLILGPGTGTSDSIETEKRPGTFIMPADSTQAIGANALEKLATVPVKLSNGEFEFPPEQVMAVGAAVLKLLKDTTHKPVNGEDGGQPDDETGEGAGHEMAEAMPGGQEDDAGEGMGYRPADRMAQMPPMMFADGGLVENDITRVGNSYSGGNVGGDVSFNGQAGSGTVSSVPWTTPAPATPAASPAPAAAPAASVMSATSPAQAPAPAAPMGWAERNALRSTQVTASSIQDSPERRAAQAALAPPPAAAAGFQSATQRLGSYSDPRSSLYDPNPYATSNAAKLASPQGFQPRRYADGGTVQDDERAQRLAQLPSGEGGGDGGGGGAGGSTGSWHQPEPAPAAPTGALSRAASVAPASTPAPAPSTATGYATAAQRLGTVPDTGSAEPPLGFQRRGPADAMALMPNAPQLDVRAPTVRHSGNDWAARNALRNAEVSASSITNDSRWGGEGEKSQDRQALAQARATDAALQQAQPGLDAAAMRENSESGRAVLRDRGETLRTGLQVAAQGDQASADREAALARVLIGERGANSRAGITAQAATEAARIKALQDRKAPEGYRYKGDGNLEAIPGGPAAAKVAEEQKTKDSALDASRQTIGTINRLLSSPGREGATGMINVQRFVPGTNAADFAAEVETLKAQTFLPMVQQLRGMGALSNAEGDKLNAAVGALNFNMSEKAFQESLGRIRDQFGSALQRSGVDTKDLANWGLEAPSSANEQTTRPAGSTAAPAPSQRSVSRTGVMNGRRVIQYSDGSVEYAN